MKKKYFDFLFFILCLAGVGSNDNLLENVKINSTVDKLIAFYF